LFSKNKYDDNKHFILAFSGYHFFVVFNSAVLQFFVLRFFAILFMENAV